VKKKPGDVRIPAQERNLGITRNLEKKSENPRKTRRSHYPGEKKKKTSKKSSRKGVRDTMSKGERKDLIENAGS